MSGRAYSGSRWAVPHYPWSEIGHPRYRWDSLPQEFELLVPELHADIRNHAGYVVARPRQAGREPEGNRIGRVGNNWNSGCRGLEMLHHAGREHEDEFWLRADHIARERGIALGPPLTGVTLHQQVLPFD